MNDQEPLTNEEVLKQVEQTYRDFMDNAVQNEKVRSIYKIGSPSEKAEQGEVQKSHQRTLSNKATSRPVKAEKKGPISRLDALERAARTLRESRQGV